MAALAIMMLSACSSLEHSFRYLITVEIDVGGTVKTGSAVQEVQLWNQLSDKGWGLANYVYGTAPIVDLGDRGWLVLPRHARIFMQDSYGLKYEKRGDPAIFYPVYPNPYRIPFNSLHSRLPKVEFNLDEQYPGTSPKRPFIWIPRDTELHGAREVLWHELPRVLGQNTRFVRVTVEPARQPWGWSAPPPEWVISLRRFKSVRTAHDQYVLRTESIERLKD